MVADTSGFNGKLALSTLTVSNPTRLDMLYFIILIEYKKDNPRSKGILR